MEFSTPRGRVSTKEPVEFTVRVKNIGNTHVKPVGAVKIYRGNSQVDEVPVNAENAFVLPGTIRVFTSSSVRALPSGSYRALLALAHGSNQATAPSISFVVLEESSMAAVIATALGIFVVILLAALLVNRRRSA